MVNKTSLDFKQVWTFNRLSELYHLKKALVEHQCFFQKVEIMRSDNLLRLNAFMRQFSVQLPRIKFSRHARFQLQQRGGASAPVFCCL